MTTWVLAICLQDIQPRIGHGDDADVGIDRAKGIIRRLGFARAGDGVKQGGLADIRQTDDSSFQHKFSEETCSEIRLVRLLAEGPEHKRK